MPKNNDELNLPPILANKDFSAASIFEPQNLLREARRQKHLPSGTVPQVCILDPDGDIVRRLLKNKDVHKSSTWACYHTDLYAFDLEGERVGIIGRAVGGSFAVLLAEQLFVSGCKLLMSMTSAGQIVEQGTPPYFIVIDRALRDEGTSYHYLPPADFVDADPALVGNAMDVLANMTPPVYQGATWTTDAPFRETPEAIEHCRSHNILAVEMEAAALYAFGQARRNPVLCLANVTNRMAVVEGDFEKGDGNGTDASLRVISAVIRGWRKSQIKKDQ